MKLKIIVICLISLFLTNCGSGRKAIQKREKPNVVVVEPTPKKTPSGYEVQHIKKLKKKRTKLSKHTLNYILDYASIAVRKMDEFNIPASITLAQGILESGSGRSELALKSNNHFGIKCHKNWQGARVYYDDDARGECFRKYKYVSTSYKDHSKFLQDRKRYAFLFELDKRDYKAWAKGLKKAGYATDRRYPKKLITIIEDYELYMFDRLKDEPHKIHTQGDNNSEITTPQDKLPITYYRVKKGDTLYSIAKKFKTTVAKLKEVNNLKNSNLSIGFSLRIPH